MTQDTLLSWRRCRGGPDYEEWPGAQALFADPTKKEDVVPRYLLPLAAAALLLLVAALLGIGPYWP